MAEEFPPARAQQSDLPLQPHIISDPLCLITILPSYTAFAPCITGKPPVPENVRGTLTSSDYKSAHQLYYFRNLNE
jgi:hypothetical protein